MAHGGTLLHTVTKKSTNLWPGSGDAWSLITALRRQRQVDICEFDDSLVYRMSSGTGSKAAYRNPVSKNKITKNNNKESLNYVNSSCCYEKPGSSASMETRVLSLHMVTCQSPPRTIYSVEVRISHWR